MATSPKVDWTDRFSGRVGLAVLPRSTRHDFFAMFLHGARPLAEWAALSRGRQPRGAADLPGARVPAEMKPAINGGAGW
jgi:hypothetical protein